MSFLSRHRTICAVLEELRTFAAYAPTGYERDHYRALIDEAKLYAERMSIRLHQYKAANPPPATGPVATSEETPK